MEQDGVQELGPDRLMDYKQQDYKQEAGASYDIIYDAVAVDSYGACRHLLTPRGVYITTLPGPAVALRAVTLHFTSRRRARWILMWASGEDLEYLNGLIAQDKLKVVVDRDFPLAETGAAHDYSESGRAKGKIVIDVVLPGESST